MNYILKYFTVFVFISGVHLQLGTGKMCKEIATQFSNNKFAAFFYPYVREIDKVDEYQEFELEPFIKTIYSRFSKVFQPPVKANFVHGNTSTLWVSSAVAQFNKNNISPRRNIVNTMEGRPLEVYMQSKLEALGDNTEITGPDNTTTFEYVVELADQANSIYPGSVKLLSIDYSNDVHHNNWILKTALLDAKNVLANSEFNYLMGVVIPFSNCQHETLILKTIVDLVDSITLYLDHPDFNTPKGITFTVAEVLKKFDFCKEKLKSIKADVDVKYLTYWPDTNTDGKQIISNFVQFWDFLNNYSISTNTSIILWEAFDRPGQRLNNNEVYATLGWWRLKNGKIYNSTKDYEFEEKCSLNETLGDFENQKTDKTLALELGIGISVAGTLVFVGVISWILVHRFKKKLLQNFVLCNNEVEIFFKGRRRSTIQDIGNESTVVIPETDSYDKSYEIPLHSFELDQSMSLGSGQFGTVGLAKVNLDGKIRTAAVKMSKIDSSDSLRSLMSEIKVLSYLGKHENTIELIGACTVKLRQGTLYVFLELCHLGSLESFLRKRCEISSGNQVYMDISSTKNVYINFNEDDRENESGYTNIEITDEVLKKWCHNIACGMEYLVSKNLMHGDLATRNVLLDKNKTPKICDFGLSRRLYDYQSYLKSQAEPLPWRWMSPESLRRLEFNEKSDVWAFAVTIWESFSLGDVPYPGLSWSTDFSYQLESGLRLHKPTGCSEDIYDVMLSCWNISPTSRPTFSDLVAKFEF